MPLIQKRSEVLNTHNMKTYRVLVLKNRVKVPVDDDFQKAKEYIDRHYKDKLSISFDFKEIDIPVETSLWLQKDNKFWFGTKGTKDKIRHLVSPDYHCVIFMWDKMESPISSLGNENIFLTSWTTWDRLHPTTEYVEIVTSPSDNDTNHIYLSILHEVGGHSFVKRANRRGANILDVMDSMLVNGVPMGYYKNSDPEAPDGNFACQRALLEPHIDKILYMPEKEPLTNFEKAVLVILENEGGYVNDPNDSGGETKYGISARSFPDLDIKNLTKEQAISIYKKEYWDKIQGDKLPYRIALQVFDMAVNAGVSVAVKMLQEIAGTYKDGVVGKKTLDASAKIDQFSYFIARLRFYEKAKDKGGFRQGWINRATKVYKLIQ